MSFRSVGGLEEAGPPVQLGAGRGDGSGYGGLVAGVESAPQLVEVDVEDVQLDPGTQRAGPETFLVAIGAQPEPGLEDDGVPLGEQLPGEPTQVTASSPSAVTPEPTTRGAPVNSTVP